VVVGNIKRMCAFTIRSGLKTRFRNLLMIQVSVLCTVITCMWLQDSRSSVQPLRMIMMTHKGVPYIEMFCFFSDPE